MSNSHDRIEGAFSAAGCREGRSTPPWAPVLLEGLLRREIISNPSATACDWFIAVLEEIEEQADLDETVLDAAGREGGDERALRAAVIAFSKLRRDAGPLDV